MEPKKKTGGENPKGEDMRMNEMLEHPIMEDQVQAPIIQLWQKIAFAIDGPVTWIRANIVERFRGPKQYYYHQKFRRVPTIDQCYTDDHACIYEAQEQYKRDRKVDEQILAIVRNRFYNCQFYERNTNSFYNYDLICPKERKDRKEAEVNFFIKYGDLGPYSSVIDAYMKQKHRLIFERREAEKAGQ